MFPTVLKRFEEIGIGSLSDLATYQVDEMAEMVASMLRTTWWKNSPQAKAAIKAAIFLIWFLSNKHYQFEAWNVVSVV